MKKLCFHHIIAEVKRPHFTDAILMGTGRSGLCFDSPRFEFQFAMAMNVVHMMFYHSHFMRNHCQCEWMMSPSKDHGMNRRKFVACQTSLAFRKRTQGSNVCVFAVVCGTFLISMSDKPSSESHDRIRVIAARQVRVPDESLRDSQMDSWSIRAPTDSQEILVRT